MKEGSAKRQSAVWIFLSGGVLIAAAIIALYSPWLRICDVRKVIVSGNQHVTAARLVSLAKLHRDQTIFSVPVGLVRRRLEQEPWIRHATIRRRFPHTIELIVEERRVVAWAEDPANGQRLAVGEGGVIVEVDDAVSSSQPELIGAQFSSMEVGGLVKDSQVVELLSLVEAGVCQSSVQRVDVTDLRSIDLILENDARVRLGEINLMHERLKAVEALCRRIDSNDYEVIDVRFGGEATLVPRKAVRR